jgi:hypothetical protein
MSKQNDKLEYIREVFSHTKGKTLENYVITQIWAGVKHLGLRPVAQQYVRRPEGKYALLDLYFPQINFAVEVDEPHHEDEHKKAKDDIRQDDIFAAIDELSEDRFNRVKYKTEGHNGDYDDIENQIQRVIDQISKTIRSYPKDVFEWSNDWREEEYQKALAEIRKNKKLSVHDKISFTREQVCKDIFGMEVYDRMRGGVFHDKKDFNKMIWFPKLTLEGSPKSKEWDNIMNADWTTITEQSAKNKNIKEKYQNTNMVRYTFAKYRNSLGETAHRFIGCFKYVKNLKNGDRFYERVADYMHLPEISLPSA